MVIGGLLVVLRAVDAAIVVEETDGGRPAIQAQSTGEVDLICITVPHSVVCSEFDGPVAQLVLAPRHDADYFGALERQPPAIDSIENEHIAEKDAMALRSVTGSGSKEAETIHVHGLTVGEIDTEIVELVAVEFDLSITHGIDLALQPFARIQMKPIPPVGLRGCPDRARLVFRDRYRSRETGDDQEDERDRADR
jgi:hypothetical protein